MARIRNVVLWIFVFVLTALGQKSVYLDQIKLAAEKAWREYPALVEQWKKDYKPNVLWGYNPPGGPAYLAGTLGFLYKETKEVQYTKRAAEILASYGDLRDSYPKEYLENACRVRERHTGYLEFFLHASIYPGVSPHS